MWPAKKPESTMPMFIPVPEYPAAYANSAPIDSMPLSLRNSGVRQLAGSPTRPGSPAYVVIGGGGADSCACAGCVANSGSATSSAVATRLVVDMRPPPESWPLTALKNTCGDGGPSQAQPLGSDQGLAHLGRAARRRSRSGARGRGRRGRSGHERGGRSAGVRARRGDHACAARAGRRAAAVAAHPRERAGDVAARRAARRGVLLGGRGDPVGRAARGGRAAPAEGGARGRGRGGGRRG